MLSSLLDDEPNSATKRDDFLLPTPSEGDNKGIKIRVYLFSTPKFMNINIFKKAKVDEAIKHLMTLFRKDKLLSGSNPLKFADSNAYELRLIDDDEDYFVPMFEIGALDKKDEIGEFESLALVEKQGY